MIATVGMVLPPEAVERLTETERRCLLLVAEGLQSKEIAELTGQAPKTIDKHIENACRKLDVTGRRRAARMVLEALRNGSVGAPFPLNFPAGAATTATSKGGTHVASTGPHAVPDMDGDRGDPG